MNTNRVMQDTDATPASGFTSRSCISDAIIYHYGFINEVSKKTRRYLDIFLSHIFLISLHPCFSQIMAIMLFFTDYFFSLTAFLETVLLVLAYFCRSFLLILTLFRHPSPPSQWLVRAPLVIMLPQQMQGFPLLYGCSLAQ